MSLIVRCCREESSRRNISLKRNNSLPLTYLHVYVVGSRRYEPSNPKTLASRELVKALVFFYFAEAYVLLGASLFLLSY